MSDKISLDQVVSLLYHANERQLRLIYFFAMSIMQGN